MKSHLAHILRSDWKKISNVLIKKVAHVFINGYSNTSVALKGSWYIKK